MAATTVILILVSPIVDKIIDTSFELLKNQFLSIINSRGAVKELSSTLTAIRATVAYAEERQLNEKPLRDWLAKLHEVACDAEKQLKCFATKASKWNTKKYHPVDAVKKILDLKKVADRIKGINKRLQGISRERQLLYLNIPCSAPQNPPPMSFANEKDVLGREEDKEQIIQWLLSDGKQNIVDWLPSDGSEGGGGGEAEREEEEEEEGEGEGEDEEEEEGEDEEECKVWILPIIGMPGVGKTTLAQLVFNDERIKKHFEFGRMWVTVSTNFSSTKILEEMIQSYSETQQIQGISPSMMESRFWEFLPGKRFLLVLDNIVPSEDYPNQWALLLEHLKVGGKGSKVIVTSQSHKVAEIAGTTPIYQLKYLREHHCWSLLKRIAFRKEALPNHLQDQLENIGNESIVPCKGLPFAIMAMAGLLRGDAVDHKLECGMMIPSSDDHFIRKPEETSSHRVNRLPSHLKKCVRLVCKGKLLKKKRGESSTSI